jgi:hypothetical protein
LLTVNDTETHTLFSTAFKANKISYAETTTYSSNKIGYEENGFKITDIKDLPDYSLNTGESYSNNKLTFFVENNYGIFLRRRIALESNFQKSNARTA